MKMLRKILWNTFTLGFSPVRYFADPAGAPPADAPPADAPPADAPPADAPPADAPAPNLFEGGDDPEPFEAPNYAEVEYPEGFELDAALIETHGDALAEARVSGDQAAVLMPVIGKILEAKATEADTKFNEYYEGQRAEIGKMSPEDQGFAKAAAEKFAGEDGAKALSTFEGDKVWLVKMLAGIGKAMNDDTFTTGQGAQGAAPSAESVLFPSMQK